MYKEKKTKTVTLRMTDKQHEIFKLFAELEDKKVSTCMVDMLDYYMKQEFNYDTEKDYSHFKMYLKRMINNK